MLSRWPFDNPPHLDHVYRCEGGGTMRPTSLRMESIPGTSGTVTVTGTVQAVYTSTSGGTRRDWYALPERRVEVVRG